MAHPHTSLYHMSTSSCFFVCKKEDDESKVPTTNFTEVSTDVVGSDVPRDIEN